LAAVCTHPLAVLACPLDALLEGAAAHVGALALAEAVVHQAVAQADGLFGFCEHHLCAVVCAVLCCSVRCGVDVASRGRHGNKFAPRYVAQLVRFSHTSHLTSHLTLDMDLIRIAIKYLVLMLQASETVL
jgi:hypothetical protein